MRFWDITLDTWKLTTSLHPWSFDEIWWDFEISPNMHEFPVWMYLQLVYQLEWLQYDITRRRVMVYHFFRFFLNFLGSFEFWSNLKFDQHLHKFKTWKWKTKPGSFLATPKWSFSEILHFFIFKTFHHFSSPLTSYDKVWDITLGTSIFRSNVSTACLSTWIGSTWH